ncbi:MAG: hypothetical protein OXC57_02755 [Rhodobacteraceae bacterium]|nr:hypothetical protein [Paracoccaceae bacterium]
MSIQNLLIAGQALQIVVQVLHKHGQTGFPLVPILLDSANLVQQRQIDACSCVQFLLLSFDPDIPPAILVRLQLAVHYATTD